MSFQRISIATLGACIAAVFMAFWITSARANDTKILSIGGDVTEILYALGQQDRIIAVDATSQFPADALKTKKNVGYFRALSTEGTLSVGAGIVIASERAGPPDVVKALRAASRYVDIPDGTTAEGVPAKVRAVAKAANAGPQGEALANRIEVDLALLAAETAKIKTRVRALFVLTAQGGRATIGGGETSADAILRLAGLENVAATVVGYKPVADEALIAMAPDLVIVMQRAPGDSDQEKVLALPGLAMSPAVRSKRVMTMDGLYLLGFGPRVASAARELMAVAYPDLIAAHK